MIKRDINKILLIAPPWYRIWGGNSSRCPLGLCYIAGVLEECGFDIVVYNADFRGGMSNERGINYEEYEEYLGVINNMNDPLWREVECVISEQSPDLVGISVMTPKYKSALNVANIVKNINPEIPVVFGGIHPTVLPEEVLLNKSVDIVVRGEGEYTLLDIVKNIEELHKVLGISYKQDSKVIITQISR